MKTLKEKYFKYMIIFSKGFKKYDWILLFSLIYLISPILLFFISNMYLLVYLDIKFNLLEKFNLELK